MNTTETTLVPCTFRITRKRAALDGDRKRAGRTKRGLPQETRPCPIRCECCDRLPGKKGMCLDHCHASGKFRGWLCAKCNSALGLLGDTEEAARAAVRYLFRFNRSQKYGFDGSVDSITASLAGKSAYAAYKLRQS